MGLPTNIITKVTRITRYDVGQYLNDFVAFVKKDRVKILEYYSGNITRPDRRAFNNLKSLFTKAHEINALFELNRDRMSAPEFWEVLALLTQIEEGLNTIENSSKWLRSIITKNNFSPDIEVQTVLKQFQTLEQLAKELGSNSSENDWIKIALRNDLSEEDYSFEGGNIIDTSYYNRLNFNIQSVVDNINGEKIYGIDLDKSLNFTNDDLSALTYKQTVVQAVNILAQLTKGKTPEFPDDGIQVDLVGGSNRMSVPYPVILRQFYSTFKKDDTLKSLVIKNIELAQDALKISFEVETRFGEVVPTQIVF